ncbi:unnamed protein product [Closterium sp. Naga37s-1]|nr:unnamed protein product [Closterium sp. Naga37s-1]
MAAAPDDDFPPLVAQEAVAPSELPNPKPAWGAPRAVSLRESLRESAEADQGGSGSSAVFSHGANVVSSGADVASGGKPASGSSADAAPRGQIPSASGAAASGAVQCLVVDANVLISGTTSLQKFASEAEIVTVREVLAEVRDRTARQQLSVLPFDIKCREPSEEAIKEGTLRRIRGFNQVLRFARATGDVGTLSAVDSKLLALAVTEEIRSHGRANLRAAPARPVFQKRTNVAMRQALPGWGAENVANPDEWAGIDAVADDGGRGKGKGVGGSRILGVRVLGEGDENAEGEEKGEEGGEGKAGEEAGAGEAETGGNGGAESVEAGLQQMNLGGNGEAGEGGEDGARKGGAGGEAEQAGEMPGWGTVGGGRGREGGRGRGGRRWAPREIKPVVAEERFEGKLVVAGVDASKRGESADVAGGHAGSARRAAGEEGEGEEEAGEEEEEGEWEAARGKSGRRRWKRRAWKRAAMEELARIAQEQAQRAAALAGGPPAMGVDGGGEEGKGGEEERKDGEEGGNVGDEEKQSGGAGDTDVGGEDKEEQGKGGEVNEGEGEGQEEEGSGEEEGEEEEGEEEEGEEEEGEEGGEEGEDDGEGEGSLDGSSEAASTSSSSLSTSAVALMTSDYAMQNVALQMGLRLLSAQSGMRIAQVHRWVQRCSACSAVTPDMTRVFCPDCGNGTTLNKVTVTVGVDGVVHAGVRKRHNIRGSKFSLPVPKGGRTGAAKDPVLREDQLLPKNGRRRFTKKKGKPTDVLAPDFVTFFDEVGEGKAGGGGAVNSRAVVATIAAGGDTRRMAVALGLKVNPNRVKRGGKK